jgi:hypothetical protein
MPAISAFNDFMNITGPAFLTGPDAVLNETGKQSYLVGKFLRNKDKDMMLQGGSKIKDTIQLVDTNTFEFVNPNAPFSLPNPQATQNIEVDWRFAQDKMAWAEQQIVLNDGDPRVVYKRQKRVLEQRMFTSLVNGMDSALLATPYGNYANMETSGPVAYSLHAFITEHLLSTARGYMGGVPTGWTLVAGKNPSTYDRWSNQVTLYNDVTITTANGKDVANAALTGHNALSAGATRVYSLLGAFDDMWSKCNFKRPDFKNEFFQQTEAADQLILCSRRGINKYRQACRDANDQLVGGPSRSDPAYNDVQYAGVPLMEVSEWNSGAVFPAAASAVTDSLAGRNGQTVTQGGSEFQDITVDKGCRYMFLNTRTITPVFHTSKFFQKDDVRKVDRQHSYYQTVQVYYNLFPHSRQRNGIIAPVALA